MRFLLELDHGSLIQGWILPDNPLAICRVHVSVDGQRVAEVAASEVDPYIHSQGWHSTGQCRWRVTEEIVPGLSGFERVEIHDVDTNVLIHRRNHVPDLCGEKIVLINTGIRPETAIQAALYPHFRQCYFGAGKFSEQVMTSLLDTVALRSCFISGAIIFPRYEAHVVNGGAQSMMLLHDPFIDMASRMLWLRERATIAADPAQSWRLGNLAEASRLSTTYDFENLKQLKRFFLMLPEPAYHLLYNPLTRLLATKVPEDRIHPANSMLAVEVLARVGIVGHHDHFAYFVETVFDHLGIKAPLPNPPAVPAETLALAERLQGLKIAQGFVNFDHVISESVRRSVARSWGV